MTPTEFHEQVRALYSLPGEKSGVEEALTLGPEQILSQILFMGDIAQIVRDAGSSMTIGGTWNSSFLLYLLGVTESAPLPADLDAGGFELCPVSLFGTGKPLLSADIRVSPELIPILEKGCMQRYGRNLLELRPMARMSSSEEHTMAVIHGYFEEMCQREDADALRQNGLFYYMVSRYSNRTLQSPSLHWVYLLPRRPPASALPAEQRRGADLPPPDSERPARCSPGR